MALQVLRALEGLKMMGKDQDRGLKVIPQTQRDLDRITRQVITAKKHQNKCCKVNTLLHSSKKKKDFVEQILLHLCYIPLRMNCPILHHSGSVESGEKIHINIRETKTPYFQPNCNIFTNKSEIFYHVELWHKLGEVICPNAAYD